MQLLVIAGPTATGKTAGALGLARRFEGELIGADSIQVYRGFDIGSAKPTPGELGGVRHHLLDVLEPSVTIDAARYAELADQAIAEVLARGRLPIVVGGTGLWLRALLRGLVPVPKVDPTLRASLESEADRRGTHTLHERLRQVDPNAAAQIHPNDAVRVVRALEVFEQTGRPLSELQAEHALGEPRYSHLFIVVDREREEHRTIVEERTRAMLSAGWIEEVERIRYRWGDDVRPLSSVGYRQVLEHVRNGVPLEETERRIVKATRQYARRQRTWFNNEPGIHARLHPADLDPALFDQLVASRCSIKSTSP